MGLLFLSESLVGTIIRQLFPTSWVIHKDRFLEMANMLADMREEEMMQTHRSSHLRRLELILKNVRILVLRNSISGGILTGKFLALLFIQNSKIQKANSDFILQIYDTKIPILACTLRVREDFISDAEQAKEQIISLQKMKKFIDMEQETDRLAKEVEQLQSGREEK
ncbi:hypothetical protein ACJX0J_028877, partial [Zea mays]